MKNINKEQIQELKKYRDFLNNIGDSMPAIAKNLSIKIHKSDKYRALLAILMGTELIKTQLRALVILNDYIKELNRILDSKKDPRIKKMNEYSTQAYGTIAGIFCDKYNLEEVDKNLFDDIQELKVKRNNIAHDVFLIYKGDIEKANEEIRPYISTQIIQTIMNKLVQLYNHKREENLLIEEKIHN